MLYVVHVVLFAAPFIGMGLWLQLFGKAFSAAVDCFIDGEPSVECISKCKCIARYTNLMNYCLKVYASTM